jgi:hypothetical protein
VSEEKNIINYTALILKNIGREHSVRQKCMLWRKAAMDDPFLADALEGYKNINLADTGLDSLREKLEKRVGAFVPVLNLKRKRFTW